MNTEENKTKDFVKSGDRERLINMAQMHPSMLINCIDSAYVAGLDVSKEIIISQLQSLVEEIDKKSECMCGGGFLKKINLVHISGECKLNSKEYLYGLSDVQEIIRKKMKYC